MMDEFEQWLENQIYWHGKIRDTCGDQPEIVYIATNCFKAYQNALEHYREFKNKGVPDVDARFSP